MSDHHVVRHLPDFFIISLLSFYFTYACYLFHHIYMCMRVIYFIIYVCYLFHHMYISQCSYQIIQLLVHQITKQLPKLAWVNSYCMITCVEVLHKALCLFWVSQCCSYFDREARSPLKAFLSYKDP